MADAIACVPAPQPRSRTEARHTSPASPVYRAMRLARRAGAQRPPCPSRAPHDEAVERLVAAHHGLVVKLAWETIERIGERDLEGLLLASGIVGLRQAARRFDPDHGNKFATYAWARVRGAMLDAAARYRERRAPRGCASRRLAEREAELSCRPSSVSRRGAHTDQGSPEAQCIAAQRQLAVRSAVDHLQEPLRSLVARSCFDGESLAELAREYGRSRSWACRKRNEAFAVLATRLADFAE